MTYSMPNMYTSQMPMFNMPDQNVNYATQGPTPKVKVDSNPPEPLVQNGTKGKKKKANKTGPKETWVPRSN